MKDCPQKSQDVVRSVAQGRVFHLDEPITITTLTVIQGTLSIYNFTTCALIDNGTTHSFVSCRFAKNLGIKLELLGQMLVVKTPFRGLLKAHIVYKNYRVNVFGKELTINLILLDFSKFDVILGMDFLENY